jgi:hypothetical protein
MPWAPAYATVDELREFVRIDDAADDTVIEGAIEAASRSIDYACDPRPDHFRQFGKTDTVQPRNFTATVRGYGPAVRGQWVAETDDIADVTGMTVVVGPPGASDVAEGVLGLPRNAPDYGRPFTSIAFALSTLPNPTPISDAVLVGAIWGWPEVPVPIHVACLMQASRLLSRRDAPFGIAGSPEMGSEMRLLAKLDPDVDLLVQPYVLKIGTVLA